MLYIIEQYIVTLTIAQENDSRTFNWPLHMYTPHCLLLNQHSYTLLLTFSMGYVIVYSFIQHIYTMIYISTMIYHFICSFLIHVGKLN